MKISPVRAELSHAGGRAERRDEVIVFRNSAQAPKNLHHTIHYKTPLTISYVILYICQVQNFETNPKRRSSITWEITGILAI